MSILFGGPLRPYFSTAPMVMLKNQKIFLMMRINDASDNRIIHYTTDEPLKLKEEFVDHYKSYNVSDQYILIGAYNYAWQ